MLSRVVLHEQDESDKTPEGMAAGVTGSRFFVLLLTSGVLSRPWVRMEVEKALEARKPIVLVKEVDKRHGGVSEGPQKRDEYTRGAGGERDAQAEALWDRVTAEAVATIAWHSEMEFRQARRAIIRCAMWPLLSCAF